MEVLLDIVSKFFSKIVASVASYFGKKSLEYILKKAKAKVRGRKIKFKSFSDIKIIAIGSPYIQIKNINLSVSADNLLIPFSKHSLKLMLDDSLQDKMDVISSELDIKSDLFKKQLEETYKEIKNQFEENSNGNYFNGKLYGILQANGFSRTEDAAEHPKLEYELFETDYFTHKVIEQLIYYYRLLIKRDELTPTVLNNNFRWMRTSLGVSLIVVVPSSNQIIITKRTNHASYSDGNSWYYVSVTETVSETDFDEDKKKPSIIKCIRRGALEELNIGTDMYDENKIKIYDAFFERKFFQDNIVASLELNSDVAINTINFEFAKDSVLEIEDIFCIDNTKSAIERFIKQNHKQMRAQTIFSLESYAARL